MEGSLKDLEGRLIRRDVLAPKGLIARSSEDPGRTLPPVGTANFVIFCFKYPTPPKFKDDRFSPTSNTVKYLSEISYKIY